LDLMAPGEGSFDVAEELALDQGGHQRAAIDGQEGLVGVGPVGVDGAGDQLFAGAALAQHQHGVGALGDLGENAVELSISAERPIIEPRP
jgi:hypothetical protein